MAKLGKGQYFVSMLAISPKSANLRLFGVVFSFVQIHFYHLIKSLKPFFIFVFLKITKFYLFVQRSRTSHDIPPFSSLMRTLGRNQKDLVRM